MRAESEGGGVHPALGKGLSKSVLQELGPSDQSWGAGQKRPWVLHSDPGFRTRGTHLLQGQRRRARVHTGRGQSPVHSCIHFLLTCTAGGYILPGTVPGARDM